MILIQKTPYIFRRSAFTLIELMLVIGLIMIAMSIGIPRLVHNNETPLGGSISAVMDACASARSKAILSGKTMMVVVDAESYSVTVSGAGAKPKVVSENPDLELTSEELPEEEPKPAPPTVPGFSGKIHQDVGVTILAVNFISYEDRGRAEVRFHPNGTCDEFTIGLTHITGDNLQRFVQLDSVTGLAYIKTEDEILLP